MKEITKEQLREQIAKDMESDRVFHIVLKETGKVIGNIDLDADTLRFQIHYFRMACSIWNHLAKEIGEE